ncbi:MAG TPA: hypothetical protein DEG13_15130 [Candidatus Microthrix parvicella]|jgi:hypothetical protein|uniref:SHOCT domain-containing protein n=1 Tax=Candidatus Neomicrothrix parvicella RN1 TaxID=1229780 RepID=R4Z1Q6_9ACTN|nr:hypothetical protein BN381_430059 [Candidatus Microthrix parvicella RN1]HBX11102.1 hypothetical protein [Candidatus Microthrix parvicella]
MAYPDTHGWSRRISRLRKVRYLGSHSKIPRQKDRLDLTFFPAGISISEGRNPGVRLSWASIKRVDVLDQDQVTEQITATRVMLLGALAVVAKKSMTNSFIEIEDADGVWILAVPGLSFVELKAGLIPILERYLPHQAAAIAVRPEPPRTMPAQPDPAARLQRAAAMFEQGLLTPEEYQTIRAGIIADL